MKNHQNSNDGRRRRSFVSSSAASAMLKFHHSHFTLLAISFLAMLTMQPQSSTMTFAAILGKSRREYPNQRGVTVRNMSGRRVDIFWINTNTNPIGYVTQSENGEGYAYGSDAGISSYIGHSFQVREMPGKKSGTCLYAECRTGVFTVTDGENQEVLVNKNFDLIHTDSQKRAEDKAAKLLDQCQESIKISEMDDPLQAVDALTDCMAQKVNQTLAREEDERYFQSRLKSSMAVNLIPYACADPEFETSVEIMNRTWHYESEPGKYNDYLMQVYHERPTSKIMSVPNFVSKTECDAMQSLVATNPNSPPPSPLGKSPSSPTASEIVPFVIVNGKSKEAILMHAFASKMYELARVTLSWQDLDFQDQYAFGQELFHLYHDKEGLEVPDSSCKAKAGSTGSATAVSIESDGQVTETTATIDSGDQEEDGNKKSCRLPGASPTLATSTARFDASKTEVGTIFLFCDEPPLGGIFFPHAGVHIKPEKGTAVFAVHRYLNNPNYDGYTQEYHMCPNHRIYTHTFSSTA